MLLIRRSAFAALIVTPSVTELFAGLGSVSVAVTFGVWLMFPAVVGMTNTVTFAPANRPSVFKAQVTVFVVASWLQLPCVGGESEIPAKVVLDGSTSVSVTFEAGEGPLLFTARNNCSNWPLPSVIGSGE
jgi:hypothetical protein